MLPVVIADPFFNRSLLVDLGRNDPFTFHFSDLPPCNHDLKSAFALFIRSRVKIDSEFLDQCPHLKIIISGTSGKDHVDTSACQERGIQLVFSGKILSDYVAEYIILLMLQLSWQSNKAIESLRMGKWKDHLKKGSGLSQKVLGIIGLGAVGKALARKAKAFDMEVLSCNPFQSTQ